MSKTYHGSNKMASIKPQHEDEMLILVQTSPEDINFVLKVVETHCHTALPVQLDPSQGLLGFHTTRNKSPELMSILEHMPRPLRVL